MSSESATRDLFDRWELVWHEGQYDLLPSCVAPVYLRHDASGDRTVTPECYAAELTKMKADRPDVRVAVYDHLFAGNRAWFRFTFRWPARSQDGEALTQAGMQSYRIENGKLAETWITLQPLGSAWPDPRRARRSTVPPPHLMPDHGSLISPVSCSLSADTLHRFAHLSQRPATRNAAGRRGGTFRSIIRRRTKKMELP